MTTSELGAFLRARRAGLTPSAAGLPDLGGQRKVRGLRREEVAHLAAISVDYYTRLEQGRVPASVSVLATLSRALRLDEDEETYLYEVAGKKAPRRRRAAQRARPSVFQAMRDAAAKARGGTGPQTFQLFPRTAEEARALGGQHAVDGFDYYRTERGEHP